MTTLGERNRARLAEMARLRGMATDLMVTRFVMERFLARLTASERGHRFALKGAMLMTVWTGDLLRATTDVDLHGMDETDAAGMLEVVRRACATDTGEEDGIGLDHGTAAWKGLVGARPGGGRVTVPVSVGTARLKLEADVSFGHPVTPGFEQRWYPSLLPELRPVSIACYPRETAIAEKLATAVEFGRDNNRVRDYWDIHALASGFGFAGHSLVAALEATFATREAGRFIRRDDDYWRGALRPDFATTARERAWRTWLANHVPSSTVPFAEVLGSVTGFAMPLLLALREGGRLPGNWRAGMGWSRQSRARDLRQAVTPGHAPARK